MPLKSDFQSSELHDMFVFSKRKIYFNDKIRGHEKKNISASTSEKTHWNKLAESRVMSSEENYLLIPYSFLLW